MTEVHGYEATAELDRFVAVMVGGARVEVRRGRARAYPGLASAAPGTTAVYRAALHKLGAAHDPVLDVGAGAAVGARLLAGAGRAVTAVDPSEEACAFARAYAPSVHVVQCAVEALPSGPPFGAALVVDVLGLVPDPRAVLDATRARLRLDAPLVVAEVRASLDQDLVAPARRAFTPEGLEALLVRAGLRAASVLASPAEFVAVVAHPAADGRVAAALGRADDATSDVDEAIEIVGQALEAVDGQTEARELLLAFGALHLRHGDLDSAAGSFVGTLRLAPGCARGLVGLGRVAEGVERRADAVRLYEKATRADPLAPEGWRALGILRAATGAPGAAEALERALRLDPTDAATLEALARTAGPSPLVDSARHRLASYAAPAM